MKKFSDFLEGRCWPGYKPKPGKPAYSPGSCVKEDSVEEDWSQKYKSSIDCSHPKGFSQKAHCAGKKKRLKEITEQHREKGKFKPVKPYSVSNVSPRPTSDSAVVKLKEDLRKWFSKTDPKGDWKRINSKGEAIGPCAREPGEPKPKCMSKAQRASLSKKERASAVRRKRQQDPNPERQGEPINVKSKVNENMEQLDEKNKPTNPELWSRAIAQARAKFDVYPSAYANGWASKWYKEHGGGWKSVSEAAEVGDDPVNQGTPEGLSKKGPKTVLKKFKDIAEGAVPSTEKVVTVRHKTSGKELRVAQHALASYKAGGYHPVSQVKEAKDEEEYGYEGDMAMNQLKTIIRHSEYLMDMMKPDTDLPEWVQSKITLATDYIQTACDYMTSEMNEEVEQLEEGRPSQRHPLEGHEYHKKSDEALVHIAKDAHAAAEAMKGHNTTAENKYRDQANDSATVRHYRKTHGMQDWYKKKYGHVNEATEKKANDNKPPFDGPYKKTPSVVTDKSGAKHGPMSRARDLARQAAKRQAGKMHEEKEKSRKAQIVKGAMKSKDKFEKDPIITDTTVKTDNLQ